MDTETDTTKFESGYDTIPLLTLGEKGELPPSRVKNPAALRQIFTNWQTLDRDRSWNRAVINRQSDGHPPWPQSELDSNNIDMPNINFGGSRRELERALIPYYDRMRGVDSLVNVFTRFGDEESRQEWNEIMADEITRTIRAWPRFRFNTVQIARYSVWEALGIMHFPNQLDWKFNWSKLGDFYFREQSYVCEDEVEITCGRWWRSGTELYRLIQNEEVARQMGYDVEMMRKAIQRGGGVQDSSNWELLEDQMKNNDLAYSIGKNDIRCIIGFWMEFDGSLTTAICTESQIDGSDDDDWLYLNRKPNASMQDAVILFPWGIGTNSKTHGMRGLGWKLYMRDHEFNKAGSKALGSMERACEMILQAGSESVMNELPMQGISNFQIMHPEMRYIEHQHPELDKATMPMMSFLRANMAEETGSYAPTTRFGGGQRATKQEDAEKYGQAAMISSISEDFWDEPFGRGMRQVVKRMCRRDYHEKEPGGAEVEEMKRRIVERGVPIEAFYQIDHARTVLSKPLGSGNVTQKSEMLDRLTELAGEFDDVGRRNLTRMKTVAICRSPEVADLFIDRTGKKRTPPDAGLAVLENFMLEDGKDVPVMDGQIDSVHAPIHIDKLQELWAAYKEQGQLTIEEYAMKGRAIHDHAAQHVEKMSGDRQIEELAGQCRQRLQQLGEDIANGIKAIMAERQKQAEAQQAGQDQQGKPNPQQQEMATRQEAAFFEAQSKMKRQAEEWELKKQIKMADAALARTHKDLAFAQEMRHKEQMFRLQNQ